MASAFGRIMLVTGNSEYLRDRTRTRALAAALEEEPDVQVTDTSLIGVSAGELAALTSPSLFSERTAVVFNDVEAAADDTKDALLEYVDDPSADIAMVLVHGGSQKGGPFVKKLGNSPNVGVVDVKAPKWDNQIVAWLKDEFRDRGRTVDERAADLLVKAVGSDLRSLAGAVDQLVNSTDKSQALTTELVGQYFGGRAEVKGFEIADFILKGEITNAVEALRWAEGARLSPVAITSAVAMGLRQLMQVATDDGGTDADMASKYKIPPFKVKILRQMARSWSDAGLRAALDAVAKADTDVKGGAADAGWVVERLAINVARARDLR